MADSSLKESFLKLDQQCLVVEYKTPDQKTAISLCCTFRKADEVLVEAIYPEAQARGGSIQAVATRSGMEYFNDRGEKVRESFHLHSQEEPNPAQSRYVAYREELRLLGGRPPPYGPSRQ